jgi:putative membrane protein
MPRRLSPLSVPYRVLQRGGGLAIGFAFLASGRFELPMVGALGPTVLTAVAVVGAAVLIGYETAYVRRFTYQLGGDTLDIESGVFSRRSREIPLRRIQNVDISRNVLQRLLGIAVVSFETAGGGDTEARFRFVSVSEAKRLQRTLGRLKRDGDRDGAQTAADESAETVTEDGTAGVGADRSDASPGRFDAPTSIELFALDRRELALVGVFSIDFRVPGILFLLGSTVGSTVVPTVLGSVPRLALVGVAVLGLVGIALASWIVGAAAAIVEYYDFRLVRSGEELQYERGLLQRYDGSIPFDKVQTLTLSDNPLKRYFGYASLYIETAGYAPGSGGSRGSEAAVPLAERDRVLDLIETLEPVGDVELTRPPKRARRRYLVRYLLVVGVLTAAAYAAGAVVSLPFPPWSPALLTPLAVWFAHATWRHRGRWLGNHHIVTRNGVFRRRTKIVPYYRIQTVIDSRTVFQRRLGLASVTIDTAGSLSLGGQDAAAVDIAAADADDLRDELETRLDSAVDAYRAGRAGIGIADDYDPVSSGADTGRDDDGADTGRDDDGADHARDDPSDDGFSWNQADDDGFRWIQTDDDGSDRDDGDDPAAGRPSEAAEPEDPDV